MNPVTPLLLLLGYGLALPIGAQMGKVVRTQNGMALAGHQAGVVIAVIGWIVSGRWFMALLHVVWIIGARTWYWQAGREPAT